MNSVMETDIDLEAKRRAAVEALPRFDRALSLEKEMETSERSILREAAASASEAALEAHRAVGQAEIRHCAKQRSILNDKAAAEKFLKSTSPECINQFEQSLQQTLDAAENSGNPSLRSDRAWLSQYKHVVRTLLVRIDEIRLNAVNEAYAERMIEEFKAQLPKRRIQ